MYQDDLDQQEEHETGVKYFKTDYKGSMCSPPTRLKLPDFHPNIFKGTQEQYDEIFDKHLCCHEDEFKVIGTHSFDTYEEYKQAFPEL